MVCTTAMLKIIPEATIAGTETELNAFIVDSVG